MARREGQGCIGGMVAATEGRAKAADAMDALEDLIARKERDRSARRSDADKIAKAAEDLAKAARERAAIAKRNEILDTLKMVQRHQFYARAPSPRIALEAKLVGVNSPFVGNRLSVAAQHAALRRELAGGFLMDLERAGLEKIFASRALEREWARELFEVNKGPNGRPGITGNEQARQIAGIAAKWQKVAMDALNREGGWVKDYFGYIVRTSHDADRIRRAGRDEWADFTLQHLDLERTFGTAEDAAEKLRAMWTEFKNGDHYTYRAPAGDEIEAAAGMNVARKVSQHREMHFKTAEDWLAYNQKFGMYGPHETLMRSFDSSARHTALMREFGTRPQEAFEQDIAFLKAKWADSDKRQDFDKWEQALRNRFAYLDGSANRVVNRLAANLSSGWMATQRIAKLGMTPFAMLADLSTKASELRYQGVPFFERWSSMLSGYFKGAKGSEKREVAEMLLAGIQGRIGEVSAHFDTFDSPRGALAKWEQTFFKLTGISSMTDNQRADSEIIMSRHLGMNRGKAWTEVGEAERRIMQAFDVGEREWSLLNKADWLTLDDRTYLTPDVARKLGDADVEAYLRGKPAATAHLSPESLPRAIARAKEDLALKLASYFADRGEYAVLEVGPRERAILMQGARPGTALGTALRLFNQFKAFPTAMITRTWGREIYGGQGRMGAVAGLTELIVSSTLLGIVANGLNQLVKGQDPFAQWRNEPAQTVLAGFLRGGAGTIYGDFLLGEWSRFGRTLTATLAGPTFGQLDALAEVYAKTLRGEDAKATALRLVRDNTPFLNMIYTKAAFDYLIMYRIQEWMNPGYLKRMEKRQKDNSGVEYWLRPSQVAR